MSRPYTPRPFHPRPDARARLQAAWADPAQRAQMLERRAAVSVRRQAAREARWWAGLWRLCPLREDAGA